MKSLTIGEISRAVGGKIIGGAPEISVSGVSTDTRKITSTDVFFALIGENTDGHKYIGKAFENGCRAAVVSSEDTDYPEGMALVLVPDTLIALQQLAKWYLEGFSALNKIGITGSTGKTSTKELLYYSLCGKFNTAKNFGNFNNHIGMPLTALSIEESAEAAIFEMGMGNFGEVDLLADIARPQIGIITNIGVSHISELGSRENILKAKLEITNYFDENSTLIINYDNDLLSKADLQDKKFKLIKVGKDPSCDYVIGDIEDFSEKGIRLDLTIKGKSYSFDIPIPGVHNGYNGALAIAAAVELGVAPEMIQGTIRECTNTDKRLVIKDSPDGIKVIDDTYNASPDSMKAGIDVLMGLEGSRKAVILGDMLGMGADTEKYHREVGTYAGEKGVDLVLCVGREAAWIADAAEKLMGKVRAMSFGTREELLAVIDEIIMPGDAVLVKASRAMGMEKIAEHLLKGRK